MEGEADRGGHQSTRPLEDGSGGQEPYLLGLWLSGAWDWLLRKGLQDVLRITKSRKNRWAWGAPFQNLIPCASLAGVS